MKKTKSNVLLSTADKHWKKGLKKVSIIICDALTAREVDNDDRVKVFRLIADSSLNELKKLCLSKVN